MIKLSLALFVLVFMDALVMDAPLSIWIGDMMRGDFT